MRLFTRNFYVYFAHYTLSLQTSTGVFHPDMETSRAKGLNGISMWTRTETSEISVFNHHHTRAQLSLATRTKPCDWLRLARAEAPSRLQTKCRLHRRSSGQRPSCSRHALSCYQLYLTACHVLGQELVGRGEGKTKQLRNSNTWGIFIEPACGQ